MAKLNWKKLSPKQWLLTDVATTYGLDKNIWDERLAFGRELLEEIKQVSTLNELQEMLEPYQDKADEPEMFTSSVLAVWDTLQGRPSGYVMELDACNSGAQIQSLLTRCEKGMKATGCINTGKRPDLYALVNDTMDLGLERAVIKKAIVPHLYDSKAAPKRILGEEIYPEFIKACIAIMPGAEWTKHTLSNAWNENAEYHEFLAPDCSVVHLKNVVTKLTRGDFLNHSYEFMHGTIGTIDKGDMGSSSLSANTIHAVDAYVLRELELRCNYNPKTVRKALEAIEYHLAHGSRYENTMLVHMHDYACKWNLVSLHAINYMKVDQLSGCSEEYLLRVQEELLALSTYVPFSVKTVHDGFACSPNHVGIMKQIYNDICAELYESTYIMDVIEELTGESYHHLLPEVDPEISQQIRMNAYGLC